MKAYPKTRLFVTPPIPSAASPANLVSRYQHLLAPDEQRQLPGMRGKRKLDFLLGRALLRHALSQTLAPDHPLQSWQVRTRKQASPALDSPEACSWHCAVSHSKNRVAIALTNGGRCGVDIEAHRQRRNRDAISGSYFSRPEQHYLSSLPETERQTEFYRLWSLKEAWYKAGCEQRFERVLGGLDFSRSAGTTTAPKIPRAWWQPLQGFSLAFVGPHRPESLCQVWPGGTGALLELDLQEFAIL